MATDLQSGVRQSVANERVDGVVATIRNLEELWAVARAGTTRIFLFRR